MPRALLLPLLAAVACTPSPGAPPPAAPSPALAAPASAAPSASVSAAPAPPDTSPCHFAQGVTPSDPSRVCDPCSVPPEAAGGARRPSLLHFEAGGFLMGNLTLDVDAQRMATWSKRGPMPTDAARTWRAPLSAEQLASLERVLAGKHVCAQRSARFGIPDEATLLVAACLPTVRCEIMLWGGEWDERPDAKAVLDALDAIIDDVVKRGAPPPP